MGAEEMDEVVGRIRCAAGEITFTLGYGVDDERKCENCAMLRGLGAWYTCATIFMKEALKLAARLRWWVFERVRVKVLSWPVD